MWRSFMTFPSQVNNEKSVKNRQAVHGDSCHSGDHVCTRAGSAPPIEAYAPHRVGQNLNKDSMSLHVTGYSAERAVRGRVVADQARHVGPCGVDQHVHARRVHRLYQPLRTEICLHQHAGVRKHLVCRSQVTAVGPALSKSWRGSQVVRFCQPHTSNLSTAGTLLQNRVWF